MCILKSPPEMKMNGGSNGNGTVLTSCVLQKNPNTGFELYNHQYLSVESRLDIPHVGQLKGAKYRVKIQHDIDKKSRENNQQSFK
jgi:hypothetical protein